MDAEPPQGSSSEPPAAEEALLQCQLIQELVDLSASSLQALRTRCAASNDLTRQEIRTLEVRTPAAPLLLFCQPSQYEHISSEWYVDVDGAVITHVEKLVNVFRCGGFLSNDASEAAGGARGVKLTKYMRTQLLWKQKVPERERPQALAGYPRLEDWLLTADLTPQITKAFVTCKHRQLRHAQALPSLSRSKRGLDGIEEGTGEVQEKNPHCATSLIQMGVGSMEQACQPRQPHNIQRFEVLRADLIHHPAPCHQELRSLRTTSVTSAWVMDRVHLRDPSLRFLIGRQVGGIEEILEVKYFFHRPTMSPVEVNSSPPCTVNSVGRVLLPPSEAPDGLPESLRGRPIVLLHGLTELLPDPSFCLQDRPSGRLQGLLGLPVPVNCVRSPTGQHGPIGLLLQPDWHPLLPVSTTGFGVAATTGTRDLASTTSNNLPRRQWRQRTWSTRTQCPQPPSESAAAGKLSVDGLLQMSSSELQDTMRRLGSNSEDRSHLTATLSCVKSVNETGGDAGADSKPQQDSDVFSLISLSSSCGSPSTPLLLASTHGRSISISVVPCSDDQRPYISAEEMTDAFNLEPSTPPATRASKTRSAKPSHTPPPPSRKLLQLFPNITLMRSKSHESQLANRIEEPATNKACKKNKMLAAIHINGSGNSSEDSALRSPLSARTPGPVPASAPYMKPATPTLLDNVAMHRSSPQTLRRDIGLAVTHRFSTKSWLSQTCQVCHKSMMFGVKCKHCKLKCHNRCTKEAPSCRISFLTLPRMRRAESVPSDINNRIDHTQIPQHFGTLPKAITKSEPPPRLNQLDSSSNPSSATSSTPSSPAHFQQSNPPSVSSTPPPSPPITAGLPEQLLPLSRKSQVAVTETQLTAAEQRRRSIKHSVFMFTSLILLFHKEEEEEDYPAEDEETSDQCGRKKSCSTEEYDEDELDDLPSSISRRETSIRWRSPISRKASQTSVYLQEWDIPYEQLQLGELIGKGRWGKVHRGRWHGEVAIRLLEIDGNNQDHLKLFKKEVMNYRQTRHENVVLFMGACMAPPHLAIITSFCTGLTLYSVVRERGHMLDINKTRQIALDIVKQIYFFYREWVICMPKDIIHKDLKSKNVFYDTNKVVITDFGLFGMSGVVQEGRRKNVLRIPQGWIYYLAPEIVRKMSPEVDEDQLPFSKAADVYAFGTIWYELQARDWPITKQPVEAKIWLVGSSEGIKKVVADTNLGKEVTEILSACWSFEANNRPTFTQMAGMLERLPKLNRRLSHPGHFWKTAE
ncbi:hypothetical protein L3Q82_019182 [Scortum barcoo]|uniref:Uncharacterized protein n=1 Tax=Scortum barcoo TaxID=214431 RepID=A0ACB8VGP8_9TELE|nr:hypothetical protein L3Q82_019182 [Scortum barcoo]